MFFTVKIYDLNNVTNPYMQFQFEASKLKMYLYVVVGTLLFSWTYRRLSMDAEKNIDGYDVVYYEKSTGKKLVGLTIEVDEYTDADVSFSI